MHHDTPARLPKKEVPLRMMAAAMFAKFGDEAASIAFGQAAAARSVDEHVYDRWQSIARSIQQHAKREGQAA
jgi:hypothetical protein